MGVLLITVLEMTEVNLPRECPTHMVLSVCKPASRRVDKKNPAQRATALVL